MRHLTASRVLAPAFDQRQPARLNRLPTTRSLAANGALQPSLFDERDMAEIECPERYKVKKVSSLTVASPMRLGGYCQE